MAAGPLGTSYEMRSGWKTARHTVRDEKRLEDRSAKRTGQKYRTR